MLCRGLPFVLVCVLLCCVVPACVPLGVPHRALSCRAAGVSSCCWVVPRCVVFPAVLLCRGALLRAVWCLCRVVVPRPLLLLVLCPVFCLLPWCRSPVWAVLCGLRCFLCCGVLCWCCGALLFGVLPSCAVIGCTVSGGVVRCAVWCAVASCVVPSCVVVRCSVFFGAMQCRHALRRLVYHCAVPRFAAFAVLSGAPPLLLLPLLSGCAVRPVFFVVSCCACGAVPRCTAALAYCCSFWSVLLPLPVAVVRFCVLPCSPDHWVCLGAAHRLSHCPHCGDLNPHHCMQPAAPAAPPVRQPPQLLGVTHRCRSGQPGRALRGRPNGPCVDHSHSRGRRTPATPQPTPTPQWGRLERSGPPHPSRPLPPPPWPPPPGPTSPSPLSRNPGAGSVGGDGTRGGGRLPPAHLPPVQHRFWPAEGNSLPTQRTSLPGKPPPCHTAETPGEQGVFSGRPPGRPQSNHCRTDGSPGPARLRQGPRGMLQRGASLEHPRRHPRGDRGDHPPPTPTRPRRPRKARGLASAPANRAQQPDRDPGPASRHQPTCKAAGHTNSNTLTRAHYRHCTAAP